jgi:hypothetical protein
LFGIPIELWQLKLIPAQNRHDRVSVRTIDMPYEVKKLLGHGTTNPIVARLSVQILEILKQCNAPRDIQDKVSNLYVNSLQKKLLRCWEIKERSKEEFAAAIGEYRPPSAANAPVKVPQIARLEEECHNFLYEAKNFIRDLLQVVNYLYGTTFEAASEFSLARKGSLSSSSRRRRSARTTGGQRCSRRQRH